MQSFTPSLTGNTYNLYNRARRSGSWELSIQWENLGIMHLTNSMQHIAWHVASQQAFIEQVGQISAAKLLMQSPTPELRFALSRSVADEARHAEIFGRFALACRGKLDHPDSTMINVQNELNSAKDYDYHFLTHVILENYALEQFSIYRHLFNKCLLGQLYDKTIMDESRHVAVGLSYFQSQTSLNKNKLFKYEREIMQGPARIPNEVIQTIAELLDASEHELQNRFRLRHENFIGKIFN